MDYSKLFNDELDILLNEKKDKEDKTEARDNMRTSIEEDMNELRKIYRAITENIKERYPDVEARVSDRDDEGDEVVSIDYTTGDTLAVTYKGEDKITYKLLEGSKLDKEKETNEFMIEVGGYLRLPNILVKVLEDNTYCYYEEYEPLTDPEQDILIEENRPENKEDTQLDKVLEKHIKRMAQSIAADNFID